MDGLGSINWFGYSPALDLLELYDQEIKKPADESEEELNILVVCSGDPRHVLNTIAYRLKHQKGAKKRRIRFFVYEKMLELYARDFLLLSLAIEHPLKRSILEKTELYLDIYGNLLTREHTSQYILAKSNECIKCITDPENLNKHSLQLFDFNQLKFKERDFLEGIFKYWRLKETNESGQQFFPAEKCWDVRLRAYFGNRYDTRANAYDWDFSMKLIDRKDAAIINNKIYAKWRETGVAFELRDTEYCHPNKTLASGMVFNDKNGDKTSRRGYFGDVVIGPFIGHGLESDNPDFYKKANDNYRHTSVDIARHNMNKIFESLAKSCGFDVEPVPEEKNLNQKLTELKIEEVDEEEPQAAASGAKSNTNEPVPDYMSLDDCKVVFLPLTGWQDLETKSKYENFFDIVYFSNTGASLMNKNVSKVLRKSGALVLFETAKFMIEMKNEQITTFSTRLQEIAKECGLTSLQSASVESTSEGSQSKVQLEPLNYYKFKNC